MKLCLATVTIRRQKSIPALKRSVADPGSEKRGAPRVLGAPKIFLLILANLGDFLKYLPKNRGGGPPLDPPLKIKPLQKCILSIAVAFYLVLP